MNPPARDLRIARRPAHAKLHRKRTLSRWAGVNGARRPECLLYSRNTQARNASELSGLLAADSEKCGADAYFGGPFFDGDFEIVAHSHGKRGELAPEALIDIVV